MPKESYLNQTYELQGKRLALFKLGGKTVTLKSSGPKCRDRQVNTLVQREWEDWINGPGANKPWAAFVVSLMPDWGADMQILQMPVPDEVKARTVY